MSCRACACAYACAYVSGSLGGLCNSPHLSMRRLKRGELNDWPKVLELSSGKQGPLTPQPCGLLLQAPPAGWFCPLPHSQGPSLWACALRGHTSPVKGGLRLGGWPAAEYSGYGAREPTTPKAVNSLGVTTQEKQALWDPAFPPSCSQAAHAWGVCPVGGSSSERTRHSRLGVEPTVPPLASLTSAQLPSPAASTGTASHLASCGTCRLGPPRPSFASLRAHSPPAAPAPAPSPVPLTRGSPTASLVSLGPLHLHALGCLACSLPPI